MAPVKALVLVGGPWHDGPGARDELSAALLAHADAELTVTDDQAMLSSDRLSEFDVVIVYTTSIKLGEAEETSLSSFVRGGKGLFGLHGAATMDKENRLFHEMLGCTFVEHPPLGEVSVQVRVAHPITADVPDFSVPDELYILDFDPMEIDLLTTARLGPEDAAQLSAYTREWGAGRVYFLGLGHDARCLESDPFRRLAGQGLMWAAGR